MKGRFTPALAFKALTPFYDRVKELLGFGRAFERKVLDMAAIRDGEEVLDAGSGTGSLLIEAKSRCPNIGVIGIDPDPEVLRAAKSKLEHAGFDARLVQGFAQELPFPTASFDLVISVLIFHHLSTEVKRQAIKEIYRVLKDYGRFLLADLGKPETALSYILLNIGSIFDGRDNMRINLEGMLPSLLQEVGFQVTDLGSRYRGVQFLLAKK